MLTMPLVYVIVLNWNGWRDTAHYVASLKASNYPNLHSVVVHNGSTDGSPQLIAPLLEAPWGELVMATHAPAKDAASGRGTAHGSAASRGGRVIAGGAVLRRSGAGRRALALAAGARPMHACLSSRT